MELEFQCGDEICNIGGFASVIGADGTFSAVRNHIMRVERMNFQQVYIPHMYLELSIPASESNEFILHPNRLHIWPRGDFMLIALPNADKSFTSTLFAPASVFDELNTEESFMSFFSANFPDAVSLIGEARLKYIYHNYPRGSLVSIKCTPYNHKGKGIIIGDASHSQVPFYGQGMNAGFEDVKVLMHILETKKSLKDAYDLYTASRHKDLIAICDLSMANYDEMRRGVQDWHYLARRSLERILERVLKDRWLRLYTMVTFRPDIPYSLAYSTEKLHTKILSAVVNTAIAGASVAVVMKGLRLLNQRS
ncbi:hypothetical protein CANCADRAFT_31448 [Tortispora caseinolytica NRRL Y-17796]|uniref:FAD-binding domain-containing protein n=1 Tax=Tortispora caseinolytica NRRL Y-17796 TaxID=767744 RepID=A0A1E4TFI4_9ASCO|nr:hypothetical protein CANCADRAFT_31448 [Tortispora caseinolytica NRRL Y-17796]